MKQLTILGATGSVGQSTLDIVRSCPDDFSIYCLTAHSNSTDLIRLAREFLPKLVVMSDTEHVATVVEALSDLDIEVMGGADALCVAAARPVDMVIASIVGFASVKAIASAVRAGQVIALANKECLVAAGHLIMPMVRQYGATILPIDSEHNAIFQCMAATHPSHIALVTLTASGGAFRDLAPAEMLTVTPAQALQHPNWTMGPKVTIDSASLMNKGLELIEAAWLFDLPKAKIEAVIHPQSLVHSMVSYIDGSILAQLGPADMRVPISHALAYPDRLDWGAEFLDPAKLSNLEFRPIEPEQFPAFDLAKQTIGEAPAKAIALNASNEIAVEAFLCGRIPFVAIPRLVAEVLGCDIKGEDNNLDGVIALDAEARALASQLLDMQF